MALYVLEVLPACNLVDFLLSTSELVQTAAKCKDA